MKSIVLDASVFIDAFQSLAPKHAVSRALIDLLVQNETECVIPMHAFFEISATLNRRSKEIDYQSMGIAITSNAPLHIFPVPIDEPFVQNHLTCDLPKLRAGDLLYFVIAKSRSLPLVTHDTELHEAARNHGLSCYSAEDALRYLWTT